AHGFDVSNRLRYRMWRLRYRQFEKADGIITVSEFSRNMLLELGLSGEKIHVIPCGADVPDECPSRSEADPVRVVAVGRMVQKKAPLLLLRAFQEALKATRAGAVLEYVGDGPLFSAAQDFVREQGLEENVVLHGSKPNSFVAERLRAA